MATVAAPTDRHQGTDAPRHHPRRTDHRPVHRCQRLSGPEDRHHLRHLDPCGGHLHGGAKRFFQGATIQENNIVQTIASAAGTLSAIIFVLPGLVMVGWWTGFPFWLSVAVIAIGGILGVMYSVPLRRALVTGTDLPYPEGVAAAEVLKVGAGVGGVEENQRGLAAIVMSSLVSAGYAILAQTRLVAATWPSASIRSRRHAVSTSMSMALIGVGHLVGLASASPCWLA